MKKFLKTLCVLLCLVMSVSVLASCGGNKDSGKLVLGASGPLTGGAAIYGVAVKNAAQMAVDEINANGGINGVQIEFVMLDDKHDATQVSSVYAALMEKDMQVSLGTVTTGPALEFKGMAKDDNLFCLTPSASGDAVTEFDNFYQMCFADGNQGQVAAAYVNANFAGQTIGVFYKSDDSYSKGIYDNFKSVLSGVTTIDTSFTDANATDFSSQINQLKDCTFIFMPIYYTPASLFMTQAKGQIANSTVYYGCDGFDGIDSMGGFDLNTIPQEVSMLSHFNSKATEGNAKAFIDKYVARYGSDTLNQFGASAYDCVYAIVGALKEAKVDDLANKSASELCEILKAQFNGGYSYSGATGTNITWKSTGAVQKDAVKYTIKAANAQ